jgi:MSHA pilin protein MshC
MISFCCSNYEGNLSPLSPGDGSSSAFVSGERGFTLVEFIAVILLLSVLSLIVITSSNNAGVEAEVAGATEVLKNHLRYAQTKAMNAQLSWGLNFSSSTYTMRDANGGSAIPPGDLPQGMAFAASLNPVMFDNRWGSPVDSSNVPIATNITITVSKGGVSRTITVTRNTGFIP